MILTKIFNFDSAHKLDFYEGKCKNLHGHTYILHVSVKGNPDENGFVIDFHELKKIVQEVIDKIDHRLLNDIIEKPTAENIVMWIWNELKEKIPLYELKLYENPTSYVTYSG